MAEGLAPGDAGGLPPPHEVLGTRTPWDLTRCMCHPHLRGAADTYSPGHPWTSFSTHFFARPNRQGSAAPGSQGHLPELKVAPPWRCAAY